MAWTISLQHWGIICVLLLTNVEFLSSKSIEFIVTGDGCECPREIPFEIGIPVIKPPLPPVPKDHSYKVEVPAIQRAKVRYSLDFQIEQPAPPVPPVAVAGPDLIARVDRVQIVKPDCPHLVNKPCSCGATPCNCGSTPCSCGSRPCYCGAKTCTCAASPCSCGMPRFNYPFNNPYSCAENYKFGAPTNYIRVRRGLSKTKIPTRKKFIVSGVGDKKNNKKKLQLAASYNERKKRELNEDMQMFSKNDANKLDLRIPEILQFMPEVLSSDFEMKQCFCCCSKNKPMNDQFIGKTHVPRTDLIPRNVKYGEDCPTTPPVQVKDLNNYDEEKYPYDDKLGYKYNGSKGLQQLRCSYDGSLDSIVGNAREYSPNMEDLIRDIVHSHPDFIAASDHGAGILTPSVQTQNHDAMAFLRRLIGGRLSKMYANRGKDQYASDYSYEDNSYERPYRSSNPSHLQLESNEYSAKENSNSLINADDDQGTLLNSSKGNQIQIVKFKKHGKILQVLSSQ